jgi:hypothetical protein
MPGIEERTFNLLDQRAVYEGTQYEQYEVAGELVNALPWYEDTDASGQWIPVVHRKPYIQTGLEATLVNSVVDLTVGEGRFPAIETPDQDKGTELLMEALGDENLGLEMAAEGLVVDLGVVASAAIGIRKYKDGDGLRFERLDFQTEWCSPVFVGERRTHRARMYAEDLGAAGVALPEDAQGPYFPAQPGARRDDLVFMRYEYPFTSTARDGTVHTYWRRQDFTDTLAITYFDLEVEGVSSQAVPEAWEVETIEKHGIGSVPVVWMKGRGASHMDSEGRPILTQQLRSLVRGLDYAYSLWCDGVYASGAPTLVELDVIDPYASMQSTVESGRKQSNVVATGPRAVLTRLSRDNAGGGKVSYLETPSTEAFENLTERLEQQAHSAARMDKDDGKATQRIESRPAVERLMRRTLALVASYRKILTRGLKDLARKVLVASGEKGAVQIEVKWPQILDPAATDANAWAGALATAVTHRFISQETAVGIMLEAVGSSQDIPEEQRRIEKDDMTRLLLEPGQGGPSAE